MNEKQRRDYGSGSISQRKDGTWTARMVIGVNEKGKPRIKDIDVGRFYKISQRSKCWKPLKPDKPQRNRQR